MLRSGKGVLEQIVNGLARYRKYSFPPEDLEAWHESVEKLAEVVKGNGGSLILNPFRVKRVKHTRVRQMAVCEGVTITNRSVISEICLIIDPYFKNCMSDLFSP